MVPLNLIEEKEKVMSKTFRLILFNVATTLVTLAIVAGVMFTGRAALAQTTAPDGPVAPAAAEDQPRTAASGEGLVEVDLTTSLMANTGDGTPPADANPDPSDLEFGPDAPDVTFSYFRLLGMNFNPRTTTSTFGYGFNGCIYRTGGSDNRWVAPVHLPNGSVIKYLRIYFDDTNAASNANAWLTRYQPGLNSLDLTTVSSAGSSGYGTTLSPEITHTVDSATYDYQVIFAPNVSDSTVNICGMRVAYYAPLFPSMALPAVMRKR